MKSYIAVFANPYFQVTGEDGSFKIENVPPGTYKLTAWREVYGAKEQDLTVSANQQQIAEDHIFGAGIVRTELDRVGCWCGAMTRVHLCPTGQRYCRIHAAEEAGALDAFRFRSRYFTDTAAMPHLGHFSSSMASVLRLGEKTETA